MFNAGLKNIVESIIFASQEEISSKQIKEILDSFKIESKVAEIEEIIEALNIEYLNNDNAFEIIKIAGGYQYATRKKFAHFIGKLYTETQRKKLSPGFAIRKINSKAISHRSRLMVVLVFHDYYRFPAASADSDFP